MQAAEPQWICECGDETRIEKLAVPLDAYHGVRAHDDWFLIKHDHETLEFETVVDQRKGYVVVEKLRL